MRVLLGGADRRPFLAVAAMGGAIAVLATATLTHRAVLPAATLVLAVAFALFLLRPLLRWNNMLLTLLLMMMLVPVKRYGLPGSLPFELEPYRIFIMLLAGAWVVSLFIDPRVRLRSSPFQGPVLLWCAAAFASIATNKARIEKLHVDTLVIKQLSIFISFILVFFLLVSLVRTRAQIELFVRVLVTAGSVVAFFGLIEYRTGYNLFNHLHAFAPILRFNDPAIVAGLDATYLSRAGEERIYASASHPIELSATLMLLFPLAIYLLVSTKQRRWGLCAALLTMGTLATVSRTGVIMLVVIAVVYLRLRPVQTKRLWPVLLPALIVIYFALPNTIGSFYSAFFPQEGLLAEQSQKVEGNELGGDGRLADLGPSMTELAEHPIFGQGNGTRVSARAAATEHLKRNARLLDDQWLFSLLETGIVGLVAIVVLFRRASRRMARVARCDDGPDGWLAAGLSASTYAFMVAMFTFDAFSFLQVTFLMFVLLALASALLVVREQAAATR